MKHISVVISVLALLFCISTAQATADKESIAKNVDTIVAGIEEGQKPIAFKSDAYEPYAFIMEESGTMLVHPSLAGQSLKEKAPPVFDALAQATPEGVWVEYEWKGKTKHTYAKKTKGLIIGSGY